eukprot:sb/3465147/
MYFRVARVENLNLLHSSSKGAVSKGLPISTDILAGDCYILTLVVSAVGLRLRGKYCQLDGDWRSSFNCAALGCLFSFSSHGSFLLITMMSAIRFMTCLDLVKNISIRAIWIISIVMGVLNLVHAILPTLPLSIIQQVFRTDILLTSGPENPLISRYDEYHIRKMHSLAFDTMEKDHVHGNGFSTDTGEDHILGIETIFADLRKITSKPSIFDYMSIGYYGNSPLCVANIYKNQASYLGYKIAYCVIVGVLISILTVSYVSILVASFFSASESGPDNNDYVSKLALKLSLLIGSQMIAWLSYIITGLYYSWINPAAPPGVVYELFSLVVLPSNSLLNPIFYSTIYRSIIEWAWKLWRKSVPEISPLHRPSAVRPKTQRSRDFITKISLYLYLNLPHMIGYSDNRTSLFLKIPQ